MSIGGDKKELDNIKPGIITDQGLKSYNQLPITMSFSWAPGLDPQNAAPTDPAGNVTLAPPSGMGVRTYGGPIPPGTAVHVEAGTGLLNGVCIGAYNSMENGQLTTPGNLGIGPAAAIYKQAMNAKQGMRMPKMQEITHMGAKIRKIIEQGPYNTQLLAGLASHGQLIPNITQNLPPMKNISTAIDEFQKNITGAMKSAMGSTPSSMGNIAKNIAANPKLKKKLMDALPPEIHTAYESMTELMPSFEASDDEDGYVMGNRVNASVLTNNAINLLSTCTTVTELVYAFQELHDNTAHHGLDQLANVVVVGETAWGNTEIYLSPNGDLYENVSANTANTSNTYKNEMKSSSGAPSAVGGQNMFSDSAGTMMDMLKRLSPDAQKNAKKLLDKVNKADSRKEKDKAQKKLINGGTVATTQKKNDPSSGAVRPPNLNAKSDEWGA